MVINRRQQRWAPPASQELTRQGREHRPTHEYSPRGGRWGTGEPITRSPSHLAEPTFLHRRQRQQQPPLTRILIITDAWLPQVNGVARSIEALVREAPSLGVEIKILAPHEFRTAPLPTYPQVRIAERGLARCNVASTNCSPILSISRREGPIGLCAWLACRRAGRSFTTCYHTRFPEYLAARRMAPTSFVYPLLRRFHNAGSGVMVSTKTLERELDARGFVRLMRWSRGRRLRSFSTARREHLRLPKTNFPDLCACGDRKESRRFPVSGSARFEGRRWGRTVEEDAARLAFLKRILSANCTMGDLPPPTRAPTYSCFPV